MTPTLSSPSAESGASCAAWGIEQVRFPAWRQTTNCCPPACGWHSARAWS